jgi:DNA-binding transcriptional LysR family regulator
MVTYKQLEALHWICRLGGFQQAAKRLNTSQAAISKRIQELESTFGTPLFDRSRREARLTPKAQELLPMVDTMLRQRDQFEDAISQPDVLVRNLRLGVTELTALTWLPALVAQIQKRYPLITIEPDVDLSASLRDKLAKDKVDVIVLPDAFEHPGCVTTPLAKVENAWFCRRDLIASKRTLPLEKLAAFPMLTQNSQSGSGVVLGRWLLKNGIHTTQSVTSNSLLALVGLTISGLGVASMPYHCVRGLFGSKFLSVVKTDPPLPAVPYVAVYRADAANRLIHDVITIAQLSCDFRQVIKGGVAAP